MRNVIQRVSTYWGFRQSVTSLVAAICAGMVFFSSAGAETATVQLQVKSESGYVRKDVTVGGDWEEFSHGSWSHYVKLVDNGAKTCETTAGCNSGAGNRWTCSTSHFYGGTSTDTLVLSVKTPGKICGHKADVKYWSDGCDTRTYECWWPANRPTNWHKIDFIPDSSGSSSVPLSTTSGSVTLIIMFAISGTIAALLLQKRRHRQPDKEIL